MCLCPPLLPGNYLRDATHVSSTEDQYINRTPQVIAAVSIALVLAACGADSGQAGDPALGEELYATKLDPDSDLFSCAECHSLDGSDSIGPTFQGIGERAGQRVAGLSAEEYLRESIVDPQAYVVEGFFFRMPGVIGPLLTEEDINNLIAFMLTQ